MFFLSMYRLGSTHDTHTPSPSQEKKYKKGRGVTMRRLLLPALLCLPTGSPLLLGRAALRRDRSPASPAAAPPGAVDTTATTLRDLLTAKGYINKAIRQLVAGRSAIHTSAFLRDAMLPLKTAKATVDTASIAALRSVDRDPAFRSSPDRYELIHEAGAVTTEALALDTAAPPEVAQRLYAAAGKKLAQLSGLWSDRWAKTPAGQKSRAHSYDRSAEKWFLDRIRIYRIMKIVLL